MGHQLMLIGQVTKLCVLVRRRASERGGLGMRLLAMLRKVDPQVRIEGGSRAQGRLDLTLTPRSVGSSEVACWDQKCCMSVTGYGQGFVPEA